MESEERFSSQDSIEIVNALSPGRAATEATVRAVLGLDAETLHHGDTFTGRPLTRIIASPEGVVKWSRGRCLPVAEAREFCQNRLAEERRLGVHHPARTWCLVLRDGLAWPCNHTPRLLALHVGLAQLRDDQRLPALQAALALYVKAAARGARLDEGLSNFGLAGDGGVFYLDDDLYRWDDFLGLGAGLGVWFRQLAWLTPGQAQRLGVALGEALAQVALGAESVTALAQRLRDAMLVTDAQRERREAFLRGLAGQADSPPVAAPAAVSVSAAPAAGRLAVLADVHGNWPALQAVLAELERLGVTEGIVLGDVVGYGPHPRQCIQALRESTLRVIKGNHDNALARGIPELGFSRFARWALEWSAPQLDEADRRWLDGLPLYHQDPDFLAVHGAPQDRSYFNAYVYRMTYEDNLDYMAEHGIRLCFHGHTHVQGYYFRRGTLQDFGNEAVLELGEMDHCLVCPGSVGQPRSRRPGAEFAVLDRAVRRVSFYRVDYELEATIADMARAEFPAPLMARLRVGQ